MRALVTDGDVNAMLEDKETVYLGGGGWYTRNIAEHYIGSVRNVSM